MHKPSSLKVSTRVMYDEFTRQGIPIRIVDSGSSMLEYTDTAGCSHPLFSTYSNKSSAAGRAISGNKARTQRVARQLDIPVPEEELCNNFASASEFLKQYKNVVIKPLSCSGGVGVSTNITSVRTLRIAYDYAIKHGESVITQEHISGSDIRLLIIAGKFRSAIERRPAQVTGNGFSSVRDLIAAANNSGKRSNDYKTDMCLISIENSQRFLQETINSVPIDGETVAVIGPANIGLGGTAHEATDRVTATMISDAERIAQKLGLGIAGVDMIWDETSDNYALIELNSTPRVDIHNNPFWGTSSDAIKKYVTWLAQPNSVISQT